MGSIVLSRSSASRCMGRLLGTGIVVECLVIPLWIGIIEYMNMSKELIQHIDAIAWDDSADAGSKILGIQSLLYQWEQMQDAHSIRQAEQMAKTIEEAQLSEGFRR